MYTDMEVKKHNLNRWFNIRISRIYGYKADIDKYSGKRYTWFYYLLIGQYTLSHWGKEKLR